MLSAGKSDSLDDEYDNDGSESRPAGKCAFPFRFEESVVRVGDSVGRVEYSVDCVSGIGSGIFVLTEIKSIGDVVLLIVFLPEGVESKGS